MTAQDTTYILESEEETSRLANQHDVIKDEMGGLVAAPVDFETQPLHVLDSATADGTWIRDLAAQYASIPHTFVGTDIDTSNWPKSPPENQTYQLQDITKPWPAEWKSNFDFVHQRLALAAGGPMQKDIVTNLADMVKPGGWIQLIEATNDSLDSHGPAFSNFVTIIKGIYSTFHASLKLADELPVWLKDIGFEDVQYRDIDTKLGAANPNPQLAKQGVYSTTVAARGLVQFASTLPEGTIPLSSEQITSLPEELKAELAKTGGIYRLRIVWGKKPST